MARKQRRKWTSKARADDPGALEAWELFVRTFVGRTEEPIDDRIGASARAQGIVTSEDDLGREEYRSFVRSFLAAFPDFDARLLACLGDGTTSMILHDFRATHLGSFMGVPATGRRICGHSLYTQVIEKGQVTGLVLNLDLAGLLRQIGGLPYPESTPLTELAASDDGSEGPVAPPTGLETEGLASWAEHFMAACFEARGATAIGNLFHPEARVHGTREVVETAEGPEDWIRFVAGLLGAFPDLSIQVTHLLASEAQVFWRWEGEATHFGSFLGSPPTGRPVRMDGHAAAFVRDGRIETLWWIWDLAGVLVQTGVLSPPRPEALSDFGADCRLDPELGTVRIKEPGPG